MADCDGLFRVNVEKLDAINMIDELMIATRHSNTPVHKGDKLCGTRVIPLIIKGVSENSQRTRTAGLFTLRRAIFP